MGDVFNMVSSGASSERGGAQVVRSVCEGCSVLVVSFLYLFSFLNCRGDAVAMLLRSREKRRPGRSTGGIQYQGKKVTSRPKSEQPAVDGRAAACWRNAVRRNFEERATAGSRLFGGANPKGSPKHRATKIL